MEALTPDIIKEKVKADSPLASLKEEHKKLLMHVHGIGVAEYLTILEGLENDVQIELRKRLHMSNKDVCEDLFRPMDKIFNSQGGSKEFYLGTDKKVKEFENRLSKVANGKSLFSWLKTYFTDKYIIDPNGVYLIEHIDGEPYPTYKSIFTIHDYKQNGQKVEWIIFSPEIVEDKEDNYEAKVRVYDETGDNMYLIKNDQIELIEDESYPNPWGKVPAVLCSDQLDTISEYKRSFIYKQVEVLDHHLRLHSVSILSEYHHGFPMFWQYIQSCRECKGEGEMNGLECTECKGSGVTMKKDVSDVIYLRPPGQEETPISPDVAGYVVPPIDSLKHLDEKVEKLRDKAYHSLWGVVINRESKDMTAYEVSVNTQPQQDKLNTVTDSLENTEKLLTDYIGEYWYGALYKGSSINHGRNYILKSPNELLKEYLEAKEKGASYVDLDIKISKYYDALYENDPSSLKIVRKMLKIEPWRHNTIDEVMKWGLPKEQIAQKLYFPEWKSNLSNEDKQNLDFEKLKENFNTFVNDKIEENERLQPTEVQRVPGDTQVPEE